MQLSYTLSLADYKAAIRLHNRQTLGRRVARIAGWFLFGFGLLFLVLTVVLAFAVKDYFSLNPPALLLVPAFFTLFPFVRARTVRRQFNQSFPLSARSLSIDIDDERIVCTNPGSSESRFLWMAVLGFVQDEKVTMLYTTKRCFLFFPTSALASDQRTELNELVTRNLLRKQK